MTQLLQVFPRTEFQQAVKATHAEWHARGFSSWDQFVSMLYCQLGDAQSLREIVGGLASCEGRLAQWGMKVPKRSTLAYANRHRPWQLYECLFYKTAEHCRAELGTRKTRFRFKNPLLSLDSSVVTLCTKMFSWARWSRQKGAVKLHLTLDHAGYLPEALVITTGKYSELTVARRRRYEKGTILIMDRGFLHFPWFNQLDHQGVFFVTRMKTLPKYETVEQMPIVSDTGIVADCRIRLTGKKGRRGYPQTLRLVTMQTEDGKRLEFLTNQMNLAASTIAEIYKDRWQIEVFFKAIKQNLRVKTFVGTSANAVWIQIWTAMIAMMLIKFLQLKARFGWSFSNLVYFLRMNLLVARDLWAWLDAPFSRDSMSASPPQLHFDWA
jgi:hypothetical protein